MKTNWKTVVEKQNKKVYQWPDDWDTRETVAEQLECSPDRVSQHLAPCIRSGEIEVQSFPVWDDVLKRVVKVVGYRKRPLKAPKAPKGVTSAAPTVAAPSDAKAAILRIAARHPLAEAKDIQKLLPKKFRGVVTRDDIRIALGQ